MEFYKGNFYQHRQIISITQSQKRGEWTKYSSEKETFWDMCWKNDLGAKAFISISE